MGMLAYVNSSLEDNSQQDHWCETRLITTAVSCC